MSATGATSGSEVRKTAEPEARWGGRARSMSDRSARATESWCVFSLRIRVPRFQVHMITTSSAPMTRGSQAPWGSLSMFEEIKTMSSRPKPTAASVAIQRGFFHRYRMITKNSRVSTNMEPVTAIP